MKARSIIGFALLTIAAGHARGQSTQFIRYPAPQREWNITADALIDMRFAIPIYLSLPDRPYEIIGKIVVYIDGTQKREAAMKSAAVAAKVHEADALMIRPLGVIERGRMVRENRQPFMNALAIAWKK